ncbi:hypothetical protein PVAP13_3KG203389 [Panicum virgatum]|uniref:Uncharacterized protein n=1 Tax=Panicum virgatum TaxID=38727 RepID=A0A8T0UVR9_PANVG|nr:hypothetical protein PVAP13_3KG203389 [Panicum virgatum]
MAGNDEETMGFFSQEHSHRRFDTDAVDLDFSQASSAHAGGSLGGLAAGGADNFPDFDRYAQILRPEDGSVHRLPPIRPGSRSSGLRGKTGRKARGGGSAGASGSRSQNNGAGSSRSMRGFIPPGSSLGTASSMGGRGFCMPPGASLPKGRGRGTSRGGEDASDADDDEDIEDEDECGPDGKVKRGNPEYMDMLIELFQGVAVDGTTAYFPGDEEEEEPDAEEFSVDEGFVQPSSARLSGDDGFNNSPMSTSSRKRGSSSCDTTTTNPGKKSKSPKFSIESEKSNQLIAELIKQTGQAREKRPNTTVDELTTCQNLAIDCGAAEDSVEYFAATQLFVEKLKVYSIHG